MDLSFASCTSRTSAMHDITQLWGMFIIGKKEKKKKKKFDDICNLI